MGTISLHMKPACLKTKRFDPRIAPRPPLGGRGDMFFWFR